MLRVTFLLLTVSTLLLAPAAAGDMAGEVAGAVTGEVTNGKAGTEPDSDSDSDSAKAVYPMPAFRVQALDGSWVDSDELRGSVVLVDLWGTWCAPCLAATPALESLYEDFRPRGLKMVGIAVDSGTEADVSRAVEKLGISYPVVMWNQHLAERIQGLSSVPTYIVIKTDWTVHKLFVGATPPVRIRKELEKLLEAPPAPSR